MIEDTLPGEIIRDITELEDGILYRYMLSEENKDTCAGCFSRSYSVKIIMKRELEESSSVAVRAFFEIKTAELFFDKIVRCLATPIDLAYLIEDMRAPECFS